MEKLLQPDLGLMIWTVVTFLLLVVVLGKTAWKPILQSVEERERKIREDLERAEKANADAVRLREQYESQLAAAQREMQETVNRARAEAERAKADLLTSARAEADRIVEKGRKDLVGESERLRDELRGEVASLSMDLAEKILARSIDKRAADDILKDSLKSVSEVKP
jgi:F-type H+-transporting ATPase subunit b